MSPSQGLTIAQTARSLRAASERGRNLVGASHGDIASCVPANLIRSSRASRVCSTPAPTALSRFFSGYATKDIAAASASCVITSAAASGLTEAAFCPPRVRTVRPGRRQSRRTAALACRLSRAAPRGRVHDARVAQASNDESRTPAFSSAKASMTSNGAGSLLSDAAFLRNQDPFRTLQPVSFCSAGSLS
jgi:hypothetical protein